MKKKYGFIFLSLGIILIIMFVIFNNLQPNEKKPSSIVNIKTYDYIKSHDINKKTKVTFPIFENMLSNSDTNSEYNKYYHDNNGLALNVEIFNSSNDLSSFADTQISNSSSELKKLGYEVVTDNYTCDYLCKRVKISNNNQLINDEIHIYIKLSNSDIAEIIYQNEKKELDNEFIESILNNIKISYDATYSNGNINGDKLNIQFNLSDNKKVIVSLDSNVYEKTEDKDNTTDMAVVRNKTDESKVYLIIRNKSLASTIKEDLDMYHNMSNPGSNVKEITIQDKAIYEYDMSGIKNYAYVIDANNALLIAPTSNSIDINDFLDITLK